MLSRSILDAYVPLFLPNKDLDSTSQPITIPLLKKCDLITLLKNVSYIFQTEGTLLDLNGCFTIVGDIHGNLRDLLRIFGLAGSPTYTNYIFLGDYVDRGDLSIEVITLLFTIKLAYPDQCYLLRGNHEFADVNSIYGFKDQVLEKYDQQIYDMFNEVFSFMPLAAILNTNTLLVHGGISPQLATVQQISQIRKPIVSYDENRLIGDLMWSDPTNGSAYFVKNPRGHGCNFGVNANAEFLKNNNLRRIIRAHQCIATGVKTFFSDTLITVFSSSCYADKFDNPAGFLRVVNNEVYQNILDPVKQLKKTDVVYKEIEVEATIPLCRRKVFLPQPRKRFASCKLHNSIIVESRTPKAPRKILPFPNDTP